MFTLISVRLANFRAVEDATFTPLQEGITGLSGPNGVGKSAFLEGTLWALYGEVPDGVSQSSLKRQGASADDECYVQVEFENNGQRIIATRSLRGKNSTAVLNTWLDGQEATIRSVKVGQNWIKNRLGVDARGFTTAVLVRQKELDSLVKSSPPERRALIEKLSGVDRMSEALRTAREELSNAKRRIDNTSGSEEEVDYAAQLLEEREQEVERAEALLKQATNDLEAVEEFISFAQSDSDNLQTDIERATAAERQLERAETQRTQAESSLESATERLTRAQANVPEGGWNETTFTEAERQYSVARAALEAHRQQVNQVEMTKARTAQQIQSIQKEVTRALEEYNSTLALTQSLQDGLHEVTETEIADAVQAEKSLIERVNMAREKIAGLNAQIESMTESLETLSDAHGSECPTCHTHLANPAEVIKNLKGIRAELVSKRDAVSSEVAELQNEGRTASAELNQLRQKESQYRETLVVIATKESRIKELEQRSNSEKNTLETLEADVQQAESKIATLKEGLFPLEGALESANERLRTAQNGQSMWNEFLNAQSMLKNSNVAFQSASENVDQSAMFLADNPMPTQEEIQSIKARFAEANERYISAREEVQRTTGEVRLQVERLNNARIDLANAETAYNAKKALLAEVEHRSSIAALLDEFRKAQIARIAPELADTATSLIAQMTNGKYVEVLLDENFTPSVVSETGDIRPVAWLSGGELSVVALALRIAIGDLLTGGEGGLLWLDEVLTAQDTERRQSLIETLRSLNGRQIVMINHTQGADDIVDKSIRLTRTDDGGTILDES